MSYSPEGQEQYTAEDLKGMPVTKIKSLAASLDYSILKTKKMDIVEEFLMQQEV